MSGLDGWEEAELYQVAQEERWEAMLTEARATGAAEERARIVAMLKEAASEADFFGGRGRATWLLELCDRIERGET